MAVVVVVVDNVESLDHFDDVVVVVVVGRGGAGSVVGIHFDFDLTSENAAEVGGCHDRLVMET